MSAYEALMSAAPAALSFEDKLRAQPQRLVSLGDKLGLRDEWSPPGIVQDMPLGPERDRATEQAYLRHVAWALTRRVTIPPAVLRILQRTFPNLTSTLREAWEACWQSRRVPVDEPAHEWIEASSPRYWHSATNDGPRLVFGPIVDIVCDRLSALAHSYVLGAHYAPSQTNEFAALVDAAFAEILAS